MLGFLPESIFLNWYSLWFQIKKPCGLSFCLIIFKVNNGLKHIGELIGLGDLFFNKRAIFPVHSGSWLSSFQLLTKILKDRKYTNTPNHKEKYNYQPVQHYNLRGIHNNCKADRTRFRKAIQISANDTHWLQFMGK